MGKESRPLPQELRTPRKHPRVRLVTQVESLASGATSIGRTDNISEGGLLVHTPETFDPKTNVIVRFNLPSTRSIQAEGTVVHARPGVRMGIRFLQMRDDDRRAIADFVRESCE